jgi:hypothetical protein
MSDKTEKKQVTISREDLIKYLAKECKYYQSAVRDVWDKTEEYIYDTLANLPEDEDIVIKLFNGIRIEASVDPAKEKFVFYKGKNYTVSENVKMKIKFSRYAKEKVNNQRDLYKYEFKEKKENENGKQKNDSNGSTERTETDG